MLATSTIRAKLERLNGWQRLWLIATILWLAGAIAIIAWSFPTKEGFRDRALNAFVSLYQPLLQNADSHREHCMKLITQKEYAHVTPCMKAAGEARQSYQENLDGAMRRYDQIVDSEVLQAQLLATGKGLALWLIPAVLVYALGLAIAWARSGFKKGSG